MMRAPAKYLVRRCPNELTLQSQFHTTTFLNDTTSKKEIVSSPRTASILVIGDEILKGQVQDTNSHFASKILYDMGIKVKRITVIGDCEEEIIQEIKFSSPKFTYVITTGGIGPTHDDITFDAVAKAFEQPVVPHPVLVKICSEFYKTDDLNAPALKLAHIPQSAKLTFGFDKTKGKRTFYPNVSVKNVYIFPGVPQLMERLFSAVATTLFGGSDSQFYMKEMYVNVSEDKIADSLNKVVGEFPTVVFGSYPTFFDSRYKVRLTVESGNELEATKAFDTLQKALPENAIVNYDNAPLEREYEKLLELAKEQNRNHFQKTLQIMEDCFQKRSPHEISLYLDCSKESSVILHLYYACLKKHVREDIICAFFVQESGASEELNKYVKETTQKYKIRSFEILNCPLSFAIDQYILANPEKTAIIVGSPTAASKWSHSSTRAAVIQPISEWSSTEVLDCIETLCIPYYNSNDKSK